MYACLAVTSSLCGALSFALQAICSFCVAYFFGASNFIVCVLHFTFLSSCQLPSGRVSYDPPPPPLLACPFATPQPPFPFPLPFTLRWKVCFEYAAIAAFELCVEQQDMS